MGRAYSVVVAEVGQPGIDRNGGDPEKVTEYEPCLSTKP
jgi:hypothetical protein